MGDRRVGEATEQREQHEAFVHRWPIAVKQSRTGQNAKRQEIPQQGHQGRIISAAILM